MSIFLRREFYGKAVSSLLVLALLAESVLLPFAALLPRVAEAATSVQTPIGYLDGIDASGNTWGWALDPDAASQSIFVHFYIDGAAGSGGVYIGSAFANLPRTDLNSAGYPGNHGYTFSIPQPWRDGNTHQLYVHGIDLSDGSENVLLSNVPKSFTLGTPATGSTAPTISGQWSPVSSGGQITQRLWYVNPSLIYSIGTDKRIWKWSGGSQWTPITSGDIKSDFVMVNNSESNIYAIGTDNQIWHWNGSSWSQFSYGGTFQYKLKYVSPTEIYGIGLDNGLGGGGAIWRYNGGGSSCTLATCWTRITAAGAIIKDDFVFNSASDIYAIGMDNQIWHWNGSIWSPFSSNGGIKTKLWYVDQNHIYAIGMDNRIWRWGNNLGGVTPVIPGAVAGSGWVPVTAAAVKSDFVFNSESDIYAISTDNQIWKYSLIAPPPVDQSGVLPVGATAVYKGGGNIWVAYRANKDTILFNRWGDPLSATNIVWRSRSQNGAIVAESDSEISYNPVTFYQNGIFADTFGASDGPYNIWLTPTGIYTAQSGGTRALAGTRIGYSTIPGWYSRQWCGLGTICNKSGAEDQWNGWPIFGLMLQKENGNNVDSILTGPFWTGFEIIQTTLIDSGSSRSLRGQDPTSCSAWTTTLGLCKNGGLYAAGADGTLRVKLDEQNLQWWYDQNPDGVVGCEDLGKSGAQIPNDAVAPHGVSIKLTDRNSPTRAESTWLASREGACIAGAGAVAYPVLSLSATTTARGGSFTGTVTGAAPNASVRPFSKSPEGITTEYASGSANASGQFSRAYETADLAPGTYHTWVIANNVQSNIAGFTVTASNIPTPNLPAPTPTTAPMATLTLERDQERVLPDQLISFSGALKSDVLNAAGMAFPQGSSIFVAIPEKTNLERIEVDGKTLTPSEFSVSNGSIKIPFAQNWYAGPHTFRIVLRNAVSAVPQLDRQVAIWVSVVDAASKLLLKGRTASTMVAHLPTEVIGKGTSVTLRNCCSYINIKSEDGMITPVPFRALDGFSDVDITRGPFFTPNPIPLLPDNIAFTLFPGDASMQRIGLSLKQFSEPLSREFITAGYQYLLGRDPSSEELSRYLTRFTEWRSPLSALVDVYNRRPDVQEASKVLSAKRLTPSYDKLLAWAATKGWSEEPSLASFKLQTGFDDGWKPFQELWDKYNGTILNWSVSAENADSLLQLDATKNPVAAIAQMCYQSNKIRLHALQYSNYNIDFEFCWKNDPLVRHAAILWAKDAGWAYNSVLIWTPDAGESSAPVFSPGLTIINPEGPILASMFGPGKYPEYAAEQQMRYPPAQLYYDLISSPEYASSIQQRFRTNIDSIYRLFFSRPATESDIAWVKNKFLGGLASYEFSDSKVSGFDRRWSWINDQWEPNGGLIASNFTYIEDEEFLKNSRFITDDVYGIRHIPGEIDTVSGRLIETIERQRKQELYQGDNFKRIVTGLYRLYLRRDPTDAEVESRRASGKDFGDIEFKLNQSSEYGEGSAPATAIRNLYRNYLGRDPSDADMALWTGKSISTVANALGKSSEVRSYAQQHPENAYIFPIKEIKIKKCGFFCSVFGQIIGVVLAVASCVVGCIGIPAIVAVEASTAFVIGVIGVGYTLVGTGVSGGANWTGVQSAGSVTNIVMNSLSKSFNEAGFNGKTFVSHVSIARAMAGQAGGVFSMTNIMENADPTILAGFRTMAIAPQSPYFGLASPFVAIAGLFGAKQEGSTGRIAQIDVSGHYGSGTVAPVKNSTGTAKTAATKVQFTKMLAQGSRGAEVLKLQKLLGEADLTFLPEYQTGYYGAKTVAAVKRFQKRNGLEQVGFVGAKTRALLNSAR